MDNNYNHTEFNAAVSDKSGGDPLNDFDLNKVKKVFIKSIPWILLLLIASNSIAYLVVRYTKPLYRSFSDIKLDFQSEASQFGFGNFNERGNYNYLAGEMELLRSKVFLTRVAEAVNMDVTYVAAGRFLEDEKYKRSPFLLTHYVVHKPGLRNKKVYVDFSEDRRYTLRIPMAGSDQVFEGYWGDTLRTSFLDVVLVKTAHITNALANEEDRHYFTINTEGQMLNYLSNHMTVEAINLNANTIRISITDHNRFKARDLVNAIDTIYTQYTENEKNKANQQKIDFLNTQLRQTEKRLADYEDYFENVTLDNRTTDLQSELKVTIDLTKDIENQQTAKKERLSQVNGFYKQVLEGQPLFIDAFGTGDAAMPNSVTEAVDQLQTLTEERDLLLSSYTERTFTVQKKKQEIELAKSTLLSVLDEYRNQLYAELSLLNEELVELERDLAQLPAKGTEYSKNRRFYGIYENFYLSLIQKKTEFEIAKAGTTTDFTILSHATLPGSPILPDNKIIYGIGMLLGLVLSVVLLAVRYVMHNKISTPSELEGISPVPILGTVPHYRSERMDVTRLVIPNNPKSALSEAFRSLRTNMEFLNGSNGHAKKNHVISVTSTISGEGKTFVSVNLGGIIALSQSKVIILDLDMRRPRIHLAFGEEHCSQGMSTILINKHKWKECVHNTDLENLSYIPAGPVPPNPSELLLNERFSELLAELREEYDVVILDTPPIGLVTDGILVMRKADLPLYVLRAEYSRKVFVKNLNRLLKVNKFKNLSVVFNSVKTTNHGYGYGYGVGYGYGSGNGNGYYFDAYKEKKRMPRILKRGKSKQSSKHVNS